MTTVKTTTKHEIALDTEDRAALAAFLQANEGWLVGGQAQNIADRCAQWLASQVPSDVDVD